MQLRHMVLMGGKDADLHLYGPLDIQGAGPAREVHVEDNVVVGSPGAQVVLDGGCLSCARLAHKEGKACQPLLWC